VSTRAAHQMFLQIDEPNAIHFSLILASRLTKIIFGQPNENALKYSNKILWFLFLFFIFKANMFDCIICILRILSLQVNINKEDILKPSFVLSDFTF
jgi:hypothetical protein